MNILFALLFLAPLHIYSQEVEASDILFLKIQELEGELASLRSELESQAYLIEKLLNEEPNQLDNNIPAETEINSKISTFRFEGINDREFVLACCLAGCDYADSVDGVGIKNILNEGTN